MVWYKKEVGDTGWRFRSRAVIFGAGGGGTVEGNALGRSYGVADKGACRCGRTCETATE